MGNIRHKLGAVTKWTVLTYAACLLAACGGGGSGNSNENSSSNNESPSQNPPGYLKVADVLKYGELKAPAEAGVTSTSPYVLVKVYNFSSHDCPADSQMSPILTPFLNNMGIGFNKDSDGFFVYDLAGKYKPELNNDQTVMSLTFKTVDGNGNVVSEQCTNSPYSSSDDPNVLDLECKFSAIDSYERPYFEETCQLGFTYDEYSYLETTDKVIDLNILKEPVFVPYLSKSAVDVMIEDPSTANVFWLNLDEFNGSSFTGEKLIRWDTKGTLDPDDDVTTDFTSSLAPVAGNESYVTRMLAGSSGGIWFATSANGIAHKDSSNKWSNYTITLDGWEYDTFYSAALRSSGTPCFGSSLATIFCFDNGKWANIDIPIWDSITALTASPSNELYAGNSYGDIFYINPDNTVTDLADKGVSLTSMITALKLDDNHLYVGTKYDGLYIYDTTTWALVDHFTKDDSTRPIGGDEIRAILVDGETIWFGMHTFGLGYLDSEMEYHDYSHYGAGLVDDSIIDIIKDRAGHIWFAGSGVRLMEER